jgi:hypothetical protein
MAIAARQSSVLPSVGILSSREKFSGLNPVQNSGGMAKLLAPMADSVDLTADTGSNAA